MSDKVTYDKNGNRYVTYKGLDGQEHTYSTANGKEYVTYEGLDGLKHTYSKNGAETFTTYKGLDGLEHTYSNKSDEYVSYNSNLGYGGGYAGMSNQKAASGGGVSLSWTNNSESI